MKVSKRRSSRDALFYLSSARSSIWFCLRWRILNDLGVDHWRRRRKENAKLNCIATSLE
jgi:hypothetical protein